MVPPSGLVLDVDHDTWGWVHLAMGVLATLAGLGLLAGNLAARMAAASWRESARWPTSPSSRPTRSGRRSPRRRHPDHLRGRRARRRAAVPGGGGHDPAGDRPRRATAHRRGAAALRRQPRGARVVDAAPPGPPALLRAASWTTPSPACSSGPVTCPTRCAGVPTASGRSVPARFTARDAGGEEAGWVLCATTRAWSSSSVSAAGSGSGNSGIVRAAARRVRAVAQPGSPRRWPASRCPRRRTPDAAHLRVPHGHHRRGGRPPLRRLRMLLRPFVAVLIGRRWTRSGARPSTPARRTPGPLRLASLSRRRTTKRPRTSVEVRGRSVSQPDVHPKGFEPLTF